MSDVFPRLLVATEFAPNASGGGAAVVRQMLKDWPADKLFWWSCFPETDRRFGQSVSRHYVTPIPRGWYPNQRWCGPKSWILENVWSPWATSRFRRVLREVSPDVVWAIPHGWSIPPVAGALVKSGRDFHVSMHDYMNIESYAARYGVERSERLAAAQIRLYGAAKSHDAICREMAEDLNRQTGRQDISITRMGLEEEDFAYLELPPAPTHVSIRIAYAGSIQVQDEFALLVAALTQIKSRLARPLSLDLFGDHSNRSRPWFDASWMVEHGNLPVPQLMAALRQCDWGFSPMALTDHDPRYNRFSLPTKFVSYLAAGLPVIALGHRESSVVKMATAYEVGLGLEDGDVDRLAERLLTALSTEDSRLKFRPGIRNCAGREFDARQMRGRLHDCFRQIGQLSSTSTNRRKAPQ